MLDHWRSLLGIFLCLVILPAFIGCSREAPPVPHEEAVVGTVEAADGVPIVYETAGAGDWTVVFVHCWGCNRGFWRPQVEAVTEAGYRVVLLDLPGHGASGAERAEWSLPGLAQDVERVFDALDLKNAVLVGHSMGGPVSLLAAARMPGRVAGIVCVDTLHNVEFEWPEGMAERLAAALREDYRAGIEGFLPQLFRKDADPEIVRWVLEQAVASDHRATIELMLDFPYLDQPAALAAAGVPIRCINAAPLGEQGFPTQIEINRKHADFDAVLMDGVGHYPQLERPEAFNEHLLGLLGELFRAQREGS